MSGVYVKVLSECHCCDGEVGGVDICHEGEDADGDISCHFVPFGPVVWVIRIAGPFGFWFL